MNALNLGRRIRTSVDCRFTINFESESLSRREMFSRYIPKVYISPLWTHSKFSFSAALKHTLPRRFKATTWNPNLSSNSVARSATEGMTGPGDSQTSRCLSRTISLPGADPATMSSKLILCPEASVFLLIFDCKMPPNYRNFKTWTGDHLKSETGPPGQGGAAPSPVTHEDTPSPGWPGFCHWPLSYGPYGKGGLASESVKSLCQKSFPENLANSKFLSE